MKLDRLFVVLAGEPFAWFESGRKRWELRRYGRQYTERQVVQGRQVELRRGYSSAKSLWGHVGRIVHADGLREFFSQVPFHEVVPVAASLDDAIKIVSDILGTKGADPLLGFEVELDR